MKCVWAKELADEMNSSVAFQAYVPFRSGKIRVAAASTFQVFVDGKFFAYGPLRSAHGYSNIAEYAVTKDQETGFYLTVIVASYLIESYYVVKEPPFFACEVWDEAGKKRMDTDAFDGFLLTDRIQKVLKYSFQRPFGESYDMRVDRAAFFRGHNDFTAVELVAVKGNKLLKSSLDNPQFLEIPISPADIIESGKAEKVGDNVVFESYAPDLYYQRGHFAGFDKSQIESDLLTECCNLKFSAGIKTDDHINRYDLYELPYNATGFIELSVSVKTDGEVYVLFDEIILKEIEETHPHMVNSFKDTAHPLAFWRGETVNAVKWKLKAGTYRLTAFEPYTMKYLKVVLLGQGTVTPTFYTYENPSVALTFVSTDEKLNSIFAAAENTFKQNAVDMLTDCPSRERAGWLCDSFFTARAELLFTGKNTVEQNFLKAYLLAEQSEYLPEGMLPMCYPADHADGNYIANWALWLIVELGGYKTRSGDTELIAAFREKVFALLDFMRRFENEDGLLENVEKWVFVEHSRANTFTQDVNYPSNMLYAYALNTATELYGDMSLADKAERIKQQIIKQSFNGEFFVDNAVRQNGVLVRTDNTTETCQYYAFYFGIADEKSHPALFRTMFDVIKSNRPSDVYPKLYPSNAFIGNFLRFDYLARIGRLAQTIEESTDYFLYMARRTGTLWEHDRPTASCNHGFASVAAEWIVRAVTGYVRTDKAAKRIFFEKAVINIAAKGTLRTPIGLVEFDCLDGEVKLTVPLGAEIASI